LKKLRFDRNRELPLRISSPLETTLEGLTKVTKIGRVKTDINSINRVILDDEPDVKCSSLLVAYRTDVSDKQPNQFILRNTCLFPKIRGIVSLCLLAFSPQVELRICKKLKCYTGALCGLGFDREANKPLYIENDIEDQFQVKFESHEIKEVRAVFLLLLII
jgi:ATP-dependent RNA helicase TDRD9